MHRDLFIIIVKLILGILFVFDIYNSFIIDIINGTLIIFYDMPLNIYVNRRTEKSTAYTLLQGLCYIVFV